MSATAGAPDELRVESVTAQRGELELFRDLSFSLRPGQWARLTGPNGSGKTTLLRIISGLTRPAGGLVEQPVPRDGGGQRLGYLGHRDGLHGHLTPWEQVSLAATRRTAEPQIEVVLQHFGLLRVAQLQCRFLSHGQKRRLALALLRMGGAALWLLDEPSTGLDAMGKTLLKELCEWQLTRGGMLLIATHEPLTLVPEASLEIAFGT